MNLDLRTTQRAVLDAAPFLQMADDIGTSVHTLRFGDDPEAIADAYLTLLSVRLQLQLLDHRTRP